MRGKILFVVHGFLIGMSLGNIFTVESSLDPEVVNQNQIFLNRKERFVKFETNDNELEIELGISIPFIKVPLMTGNDGLGEKSEKSSKEITINAPGAIVAGILMLTSFIVIPFLFSTKPGFHHQRMDDSSHFWTALKRVDEALSRHGIDSASCLKKSICWMAGKSKDGENGILRDWIDYLLRSWWFKRLTCGTIVEKAAEIDPDGDDCEANYLRCDLTPRNFQSFVEIVKFGRDHFK